MAESSPKRIQLRRTAGWRKPAGAIVVARPSKWGNPARAWTDDQGRAWADAPWWSCAVEQDDLPTARVVAASALRRHLGTRERYPGDHPAHLNYPSLDEIIAELRDHDLACWCPLDQPCHADVLLELANA